MNRRTINQQKRYQQQQERANGLLVQGIGQDSLDTSRSGYQDTVHSSSAEPKPSLFNDEVHRKTPTSIPDEVENLPLIRGKTCFSLFDTKPNLSEDESSEDALINVSSEKLIRQATWVHPKRVPTASGRRHRADELYDPPAGLGHLLTRQLVLQQDKPTPMAPLRVWRGYHGNIYFMPIIYTPMTVAPQLSASNTRSQTATVTQASPESRVTTTTNERRTRTVPPGLSRAPQRTPKITSAKSVPSLGIPLSDSPAPEVFQPSQRSRGPFPSMRWPVRNRSAGNFDFRNSRDRILRGSADQQFRQRVLQTSPQQQAFYPRPSPFKRQIVMGEQIRDRVGSSMQGPPPATNTPLDSAMHRHDTTDAEEDPAEQEVVQPSFTNNAPADVSQSNPDASGSPRDEFRQLEDQNELDIAPRSPPPPPPRSLPRSPRSPRQSPRSPPPPPQIQIELTDDDFIDALSEAGDSAVGTSDEELHLED